MHRNRNRGTASSSHRQIPKKDVKKHSAPKTEKISKYFNKVPKKENEESVSSSSSVSDSPYSNCLNEVKSVKLNDSTSELDDFRTPKAINKVSKIVKVKLPCKNTKKRKKTQVPLRKFMEDNFKHTDVNADHLQMALALSESSYEAENPNHTLSSQEKMNSFKEALEKYGFGYNKNKMPVEQKRERSDTSKKNKKSRYRYITPILKIRTSEEREALISSKVSLILTQNQQLFSNSVSQENIKHQVLSTFLQQYIKNSIMALNNLELRELNVEGQFCVQGLNIESNSSSCGCLLKDWRSIPGREPTPDRLTKDRSPQLSPNSVNGKENLRPQNTLQFSPSPPPNTRSLDAFESPGFIYKDSIISYRSQNRTKSQECQSKSQIVDLTNSDESSNEGKTSDLNCDIVKLTSPNCKPFQTDCESFSNLESPIQLESEVSHTPNNFNSITSDVEISPQFKDRFKTANLTPQASPENNCRVEHRSGSFNSIELLEKKNLTPDQRCVSPDLFSEDDIEPLNKSTDEKMECFDHLTQSDQEDKMSFHLDLSEPEKSPNQSDLNVTDYVNNLLATNTTTSPRKLEKISTSEDESQQSQDSIYISDDELNFSSVFSTPYSQKKVQYDFSDDEEYELSLAERIKAKTIGKPNLDTVVSPISNQISTLSPQVHPHESSHLEEPSDILDYQEETLNESPLAETPNRPSSSSVFIKTTNVTPMANYDEMPTPQIRKELDKFGLKPLKRSKGAKLLKYIYDSTHPIVEDGDGKVVKKRRTNLLQFGDIIGDIGEEDELIFERSQSKRVASCRIPLHIVWHNFVMSNPEIRENILLYEPLQLETLHMMLKEQGFKFNIQDLLTFLDKKCITIRTAQGQRHKKHF